MPVLEKKEGLRKLFLRGEKPRGISSSSHSTLKNYLYNCESKFSQQDYNDWLLTFQEKGVSLKSLYDQLEEYIDSNLQLYETLRVRNAKHQEKTSSGGNPHAEAKLSNISYSERKLSNAGSCHERSVALTEPKVSESGDSKSGGETHLKDTPSETKVFSQPMFINGSSITTQFLITNSNTPLVNDWADTLNLKKEMYTSKRAIHSKDPNSVASELIIRNYRISLSTYKVKKSKPDTLS